jgi:hypothetical protein
MTELRVRIRRLALDGFDLDAADARTVHHAVEAELARLLAGAPVPARLLAGGDTTRMPGAPLQIGAWSTPDDLGAQVARALHNGLGRRPA